MDNVKKNKRHGNGGGVTLTDHLLSWSIAHVLDENFLKDKVKKIPDAFVSTAEYFDAFKFPLLEEVRAEFCSALSMLSRAPCARLVSCRKASREALSSLYNVEVDDWRTSLPSADHKPYIVWPGDVFALMEFESDSPPDLQSGKNCLLAFVVKGNSGTYFKVRASQDLEMHMRNCRFQMVFLTSINQFEHIWNALHKRENVKLLERTLNRYSLDEGTDESSTSETLNVEIDELGLGLNLSQQNAISACLSKIYCKHQFSVGLVWGPPGTGKTRTVGTLLCLMLKMNFRTLVCAPTNVAITGVACCVEELLKASSARFSTNRFFSVGDILLFGTKERLNIGPEIEIIFLEYRVSKLQVVLCPINGWQSSFSNLMTFLESFVQNLSQSDLEQLESLLFSVKDQFIAMVEGVKRDVSILCTHITRSFIREQNYENLMSLLDFLDFFGSLLLHQLSHCRDIAGLLEKKCKKCVYLLRSLNFSLVELKLPKATNKESIVEFCFQMASLLFCTASSSYKLFSVPVEPFDVLVIDEAAQLKECESTIPFQIPGLKHAILAGDEFQLPAVVKSHLSESVGFGRSLYQRLSLLGCSKYLLNMQYRMHPSISAFPRWMFYSNQITDAPKVKDVAYVKRYIDGAPFGPYSFINISEGKEEIDADGVSKRNMVEAAVIKEILLRLYKGWCQSPCSQKLNIGVISPYSAQIKAIEKMLGEKFKNLGNFAVNIKTIDRFQGAEEDVILMSTVRSNSTGAIGFLSNFQRLNVALTRARHCLWVLGNERTLAKSSFVWSKLVADAKVRNCFFNAIDDERLAKIIIHVKKELDQLDDFLKGDSSLFRNQKWKILFASSFIKSFSKLPSSMTKNYVLKLVMKLSNGWRPKKINTDPLCESSIRIAKQYKVQGLYVICTTDIVKELEYVQVLRVWDILPLEAVEDLVKRLDKMYGLYTDDFVRRCKEQCTEGNSIVPQRWSIDSDIVRYKKQRNNEEHGDVTPTCVEKEGVKESFLLMKFYSLSVGVVKHLLSESGRALDLPFEMIDDGWEIIHYQKSSFVLGRSGSGKTIVLVMKLFRREQLYNLAMGDFDEVPVNYSLSNAISAKTEDSRSSLKQLYVTVNPNLCYSVKQQISKLQSYVRGEVLKEEPHNILLDETEQFQDVPNSFLDIPTESYPLVVSLKKFLLILDGTIGTSYFQRFIDPRQHRSTQTVKSKLALLQMEKIEVSYDKFSTVYWPHFNTKLTKNLDPSRVFIEIQSCIKGGMQVEELEQSKLSSESYIQLSESRSSLSRNERVAIYDIFLSYEKMKLKRGEFDLADLVNDLHHRLSHQRFVYDGLDFVYIDEVQDLTVRQLALFRYVCKNVEEGFLFAGDTAQTIAQGVSFRFQDIKSLFYTKFLQGGPSVKRGKEKACQIFQLNQNFRSHAGILKLADSVIQLIYYFFRHSIDILEPEFSLVNGEAPTLFECTPGEDVLLRIFQSNENDTNNVVSFGAEQVILVRDDNARNELPNHVKQHALVLTIFECKGLEFKDVLLYNFFSSSSIRDNWSVIYEYMQKENLGSSLPHFKSFNHAKHSALCLELKQLYVAITRAKERLWICENDNCYLEPMAIYWKKLKLVNARPFDNTLAQQMMFASSNEEWKSQGIKLLGVSNYETAAICFERAGDSYWEKYSRANALRTAAARMHVLRSEASLMFVQAAEMFESIGHRKDAANCLYDAGKYEVAGDIFWEQYGESELERACHSYRLAGLHARAASILAEAGRFDECLEECNVGRLFELGLQYVRNWKKQELFEGNIDLGKTEQGFLEKCARASYKNKNSTKMMSYVKQFFSQDSMRTFLRSLACYNELIDLEIEWGNFEKAAKIACKIGAFLLEADLLVKAQKFQDASRLYIWYVFGKGDYTSSGKGWTETDFSLREELLGKAEASARKGSSSLHREIATEILFLSNQSNGLANLKRHLVISQKHDNLKWEIIFSRRILEASLQIELSSVEWQSLISFWTSWKGSMIRTLDHLECLKGQNIYCHFCTHYFGVKKNPDSGYFLLNSDAKWAENLLIKSNQTIDTQQLVIATRGHWCSELLSVGHKMLNYLVSLQDLAYGSRLLICSEVIARRILECARFLMESQYLWQCGEVSRASKECVNQVAGQYVVAMFSLECQKLFEHDLYS